jgi:hypothetical protein
MCWISYRTIVPLWLETAKIWYGWSVPSFEPRTGTDPPWVHFTSVFIRFHRPLSDCWNAFMAARFVILPKVPTLVSPRSAGGAVPRAPDF